MKSQIIVYDHTSHHTLNKGMILKVCAFINLMIELILEPFHARPRTYTSHKAETETVQPFEGGNFRP